jgi:hypothetical protein
LIFATLAVSFSTVALLAQQGQRKSPHETISAQLGGNTITISYGRPSLHGRKAIGGSLVPYNEVWRLGADEATKLTTPVDLMIGDLKVPKGSYALFTIAGQDHWTLIVNKVADQWGAFNYKQSDDLGRTPLKVAKTPSPVEEFTIAMQPAQANSLSLHFTWENTDASTTVRLAQ